MKPRITEGIVLSRTNYGEADRILTLLTPEQGKLRLMARGVRRAKSKLAGGIELFSTTQLSYLPGRGEIGTLMSARLIKYYDHIVEDIDRVQLGYELIKQLSKATEDQPEAEYFELLHQAFAALDDHDIDLNLIRLWFGARLLHLAGHQPNLQTTAVGDKLQANQTYNFDFDDMVFAPHEGGHFTPTDIKFLRLVFTGHQPLQLSHVQNSDKLALRNLPLLQTMLQTHLRL